MKTNRPVRPAPQKPERPNRSLPDRLQSTMFEGPLLTKSSRSGGGIAGPAPAEGPPPLSVSELTERLSRAVSLGFSSVCVMGEISQVKTVASGHTYFTLKDATATLDAMIWSDRREGLAVQPRQGLRVVAVGAVKVFAASGRYSLHVERLELLGAGDLQRALEALKARLLEEGLFADARKKKLPTFLSTVGLVTSPTGAVRHDIERTLTRGEARVRLLLSPTRVQGEGAALEIASAIRLLADRPDVDVIVIARGGGSVEELWAFNDEAVARAIVAAPQPVISAVGHETDVTIADLVADVRASTPSGAAGLIVDIQRQATLGVAAGAGALQKAMENARERWRRRLDAVSTHRVIERERTKLERLRHRVSNALVQVRSVAGTRHENRRTVFRDLLTRCEAHAPTETFARAHLRVERAIRGMSTLVIADLDRRRTRAARVFSSSGLRDADVRLARLARLFADNLGQLGRAAAPAVVLRRSHFSAVAARLEALSPLAVLSRGYALATTPLGRILTNARDVSIGDSMVVRLHRGRVSATVTQREEET